MDHRNHFVKADAGLEDKDDSEVVASEVPMIYGLLNAVVEDVEIFLRKVEDELAAWVGHRDGRDYFVGGDADLGVR
jgi:hypothetical protein